MRLWRRQYCPNHKEESRREITALLVLLLHPLLSLEAKHYSLKLKQEVHTYHQMSALPFWICSPTLLIMIVPYCFVL